ncbi:MAG: hypothetical protein YHS30scaffold667_38 [Phage 65_10]|nr:MAG: hypothetical protein YHS30scaffold667_38 [Phage 65_10]
MQAIQTKYLGPTNLKGSRIKAWCDAGSLTISYPYEAGPGEPAALVAAKALVKKLGVFDDKRLKALKGFVNSMRHGTWSGNPWCKPEFCKAVDAIARAHGFYGPSTEAPTHPEEIAAFEAKRG